MSMQVPMGKICNLVEGYAITRRLEPIEMIRRRGAILDLGMKTMIQWQPGGVLSAAYTPSKTGH